MKNKYNLGEIVFVLDGPTIIQTTINCVRSDLNGKKFYYGYEGQRESNKFVWESEIFKNFEEAAEFGKTIWKS